MRLGVFLLILLLPSSQQHEANSVQVSTTPGMRMYVCVCVCVCVCVALGYSLISTADQSWRKTLLQRYEGGEFGKLHEVQQKWRNGRYLLR
jgi:hypothetical protein